MGTFGFIKNIFKKNKKEQNTRWTNRYNQDDLREHLLYAESVSPNIHQFSLQQLEEMKRQRKLKEEADLRELFRLKVILYLLTTLLILMVGCFFYFIVF